jgi:DNA-binding response OmpR family regulator
MGQRLLVVDDSRTICKVVELVFHGSPWEIESVSTSEDALRAIRMSRPDTVLLDYRLPDGPGTALLSTLRADSHFADLPIVILAGRHFPFDPQSAAGADGVIYKPFKTDELLEAVSNAIGNAANRLAGYASEPEAYSPADSIPDSRFAEPPAPIAAPVAPAPTPAAEPEEEEIEAAPIMIDDEYDDAPSPPPAPPAAPTRTAAMRAFDAAAPRPAGPGETTEASGFRRLRPAAPPAPSAGFRRLAPQEPPKPAIAGRPPIAPPAPELHSAPPRSSDLLTTAPAPAVAETEIFQTATMSRPTMPTPDSSPAVTSSADLQTAPVGVMPVPAPVPSAPTPAPQAPAQPAAVVSTPTPAPAPAAAPAPAGPVEVDPEMVRAAVREILPGIVKEYLAVLLRQTGQKLEKYGTEKVDEFVGRDLPRLASEAIEKQLTSGKG